MRFKILLFFAVLITLLLSALLATAQYSPEIGLRDNVFLLTGDRRALLGDNYFGEGSHDIVAVVIIPEEIRTEVIQSAWSYAVQYSADGLSLPNYRAAVELLMERHPTWIAAVTKGFTIRFDPERAMTDVPDPTLTPMPEATTNP